MRKLRIAGTVAIFLSIFFCRLEGAACPDLKSSFLQKCGSKLYLGGQEFREIGFNFYKAFRLYLDRGWDDFPEGKGREFARKNLETLAAHNFHIIRVMGPFHSPEFYEVFFDDDPTVQSRKRKEYFAALTEFFDDCDRLNIWVDFSLYWNVQSLADLGHHSLREGMTNPKSLGYKRFAEYTTAVVKHARKWPKIIFEIGNENNFLADLEASADWAKSGVFTDSPTGIGRVYRGPDNNINSYELARFFRRVILLVKSVDGRRLIVTGNAEPKPNAWHMLRAAVGGPGLNIENENLADQESYLRLVESDADIVSSHLYINEHIGSRWYVDVAKKMGKPLFMGEVGPHFERVGEKIIGADYSDPKVIKDVENKSRDLVEAGVSISLWWNYNCIDRDPVAFKLCHGKTDEALKIIEDSNRKIKKRHE